MNEELLDLIIIIAAIVLFAILIWALTYISKEDKKN